MSSLLSARPVMRALTSCYVAQKLGAHKLLQKLGAYMLALPKLSRACSAPLSALLPAASSRCCAASTTVLSVTGLTVSLQQAKSATAALPLR